MKSNSINSGGSSHEQRRARLDDNAYVKFGKFLLHHLKLVENPDELDWLTIVNRFSRLNSTKQAGLMYITWIVCKEFNQKLTDVRYIKTKKSKLVIPKHVSMYLAERLFNHSQKDIANFFGYKNRSSVSNANVSVEKALFSDKYFKVKLEKITNELLG